MLYAPSWLITIARQSYRNQLKPGKFSTDCFRKNCPSAHETTGFISSLAPSQRLFKAITTKTFHQLARLRKDVLNSLHKTNSKITPWEMLFKICRIRRKQLNYHTSSVIDYIYQRPYNSNEACELAWSNFWYQIDYERNQTCEIVVGIVSGFPSNKQEMSQHYMNYRHINAFIIYESNRSVYKMNA